MPLISVTCPSCGANAELPEGRSRGFCMYCGAQLVLEEQTNIVNNVQHIHADSVSINSDQSGTARLEAAEAYMKLKKYAEAKKEFERVIEITPQNPEGWWGKIRAISQELTVLTLSKYEIDTIKALWQSVLILEQGKNESRKAQYEHYIRRYEAYWENKDIEQKLPENEKDLQIKLDMIQYYHKDIAEHQKQAQKKKWNVFLIVINTVLGTLFGFVSLFGLPTSLLLVGIPCILNLILLAVRQKKRKKAASLLSWEWKALAEYESGRDALQQEILRMSERQRVLREILNNT